MTVGLISTSLSLLIGFFFFKNKKFLFLLFILLFAVMGAAYYQLDSYDWEELKVKYEKQKEFQGAIINNPKVIENIQRFQVKLSGSKKNKVAVYTSPYPKYEYGEKILIKGKLSKPSKSSYRNYLKSHNLIGSFYSPKIERKGFVGSQIKKSLFAIPEQSKEVYEKFLSSQEAAFLSGITFGGYGGMTENFRQILTRSGTTHLVALSGFHVTIILTTLTSFFLYFFSRRRSLIFTFLSLLLFIFMTGGRISIIRAASLGFLASLARESGRVYNPRNSAVLVAVLMTLFNPQVFLSVSFQLSFLAFLGIIYLGPVIKNIFDSDISNSLWGWKENFVTTTSAQLAVAPVLIMNFGQFSLSSLLANLVVLELIPITMGLGYLFVLVEKILYYPAFILGYLLKFLLNIEISILKVFANELFVIPASIGLVGVLAYYSFIGLMSYKQYKT
ncbi:MAG: ComEC/Rec2 family competence protein [Candidatus Magasanikbacteria bacterium]